MAANRQLRGAWVLGLGGIASYGLSFVRNIILARMLTKADFGLAALFSNTLAVLEVASRMSFGHQVVQSPDGASKAFRDSAHAFQLTTAVIGACLFSAFALIGSRFAERQDLLWPLAALAMVPLARGFENLDIFREQRRFNQAPAVLCEFVPQLLTTLVTWPLTLWLGDFRVVLVILVGKSALGLLMTHLLAFERYALLWRRDYFRSMAKFGWPLVLNGLLMFASLQADQFLVAGFLSTADLASYSLAFSLVSVPWAALAQPGLSLALPVLSRVQDQPERFREKYRTCVDLTSIFAAAMTLPLIAFGEQVVTLIYGPKYAGTGVLVSLLGAATAFRFLRFAPAVASMARADTQNQLHSNAVRALGLPLAAGILAAGGGAAAIAAAALVAEVAAGGFSAFQLARRQAVPLRDTRRGVTYLVGFVAVGGALVGLGSNHWNIGAVVLALGAVLAIMVGAAWLAFPITARSPIMAAGVRLQGRLRGVLARGDERWPR